MTEQAGSFVWEISADSAKFEKQLKDLPSKVDVLKSKIEETDYAIDESLKSTNLLASSFSGLKDSILSTGKVSEETAEKMTSATIEERRAFEDLSGSLDGATTGLDDLGKQAEATITTTVTLKEALSGLITTALAMKAFRFVKEQLKESVEQANLSNQVMTQTNSIIQNTGMIAGHTAEQVQKMAKEIQNNTAIQEEHAQAGINTLLQYTRIGEEVLPLATQAMIDMATATNDGAVPTAEKLSSTATQLGIALDNPIDGISRLTRSGITFTEAQKDQIKALVESGKVTEAQMIILERLSIYQGSASEQAKTLGGRIASMKNELNDLKTMIGNAVLPALTFFVEGLNISGGAVTGLVTAVRVLTSVLTGIVAVARSVGVVLSTVFSSIWMALTGDFRGALNTIKIGFDDLVMVGVKAQEALTDVWSNETKKQSGLSLSAFENEEIGSGKKSQKIIADLEKETEAYQKAVAKRKVDFERSLADLVWAHQDKVKSLKEDLAKENKSYEENLAKRKNNFKQSMVELEEAHLKKVESIEKQLEREKRKQEDKVADAIRKGNEQLNEEEKIHNKRIAIIESQIQNELSKGEFASESVLATLRARYDNEQQIHADKVEEINNQVDQETKKAVDANKDRIEDLEQSLDTQTENFNKEIEKRQIAYEQETTEITKQHSQRVSSLRTSLDEELGILSLHQDSVASVKDQARLDDISRLKRQFQEQAKAEEENHKQRIIDIKNRGNEAGQTYGSNTASGLRGTQTNVNSVMADIGKTANNSFVSNVKKDMTNNGKKMGDDFFTGIKNSISSWWSTIRNSISNLFKNIPLSFVLGGGSGGGGGGGKAFADGVRNFGGGLALVGERGPEIVNLPRGSDVIPNEVAFGENSFGGQAIVNIGQINERSDIDIITRELGFRSSIA